jgi:hypothetical protein
MWVLAIVALLFGMGDQYLGTTHVMVHTGGWTTTVSNLSAPWVVLPFLAGWSQSSSRRAVAAGALVTACAFAGYFVMTLSPLEGVGLAHAASGIAPLVRGQLPWLVGGACSAPVYAFLGYRWRTVRAWSSAFAVAGALCLEPAAWILAGRRGRFADPGTAWIAEVALGLLAAAGLAAVRARGRPSY